MESYRNVVPRYTNLVTQTSELNLDINEWFVSHINKTYKETSSMTPRLYLSPPFVETRQKY